MSTTSAYLTVAGINVDVVYKDIKNLHIGVYPPVGRVRVAAPESLDDDAVRLAVVQRLPWIKKQREQFRSAVRQSEREMLTGESHFFAGMRYRLQVEERDRGGASAPVEGSDGHVGRQRGGRGHAGHEDGGRGDEGRRSDGRGNDGLRLDGRQRDGGGPGGHEDDAHGQGGREHDRYRQVDHGQGVPVQDGRGQAGHGRNGRGHISINGDRLVLVVDADASVEQRRAILDRWYRARLREAIAPLIQRYEPIMGVTVSRWSVRKMKTKWGSCNPTTGHIWFNVELAKKHPESVEYLVVHEMTHLLDPSHGPHFTTLMDGFLPDWRARRDRLNQAPLTYEDWHR